MGDLYHGRGLAAIRCEVGIQALASTWKRVKNFPGEPSGGEVAVRKRMTRSPTLAGPHPLVEFLHAETHAHDERFLALFPVSVGRGHERAVRE